MCCVVRFPIVFKHTYHLHEIGLFRLQRIVIITKFKINEDQNIVVLNTHLQNDITGEVPKETIGYTILNALCYYMWVKITQC